MGRSRGRQKEAQARIWGEKLTHAIDVKDAWEKKWRVKSLVKLYEGFHWEGQENGEGQMPYTHNLFFSTIETKTPAITFQKPGFSCSPKPATLHQDPETAFQISNNYSDALNDWAQQEQNYLGVEINAAVQDSWFGFGVVEVGYSAEWIENPNVVAAPSKRDQSDDESETGVEKSPYPRKENAFVKHIPFQTFYVSDTQRKHLRQHDWVAYYEWIPLEQLKAIPEFRKKLEDFTNGLRGDERETKRPKGTIKVWKITDIRRKRRLMYIQGMDEVLSDVPYKQFMFEGIRQRVWENSFYQMPPTFNWISGQREVDEIKESLSSARKKSKRIFQAREGAFSEDDKEKITHGEDGALVEFKSGNGLEQIPQTPLDNQLLPSLTQAQSDFNVISGTTADQRGESDRVTATQATISDQRSQVRESREKINVAEFIACVGKLVILTIKNRYVNEIVVNAKPQAEPMLSDMQVTQPQSRVIDPVTDFGGEDYEFDVTVQIYSISPVANQEELDKLMKFLAIMTQYPMIAMSPILIREVASRIGYQNERVIQEMQQQALLLMMGQAQQAQGNLAEQTVNKNTPPDTERVRNQMTKQGFAGKPN